MVIFFPSWLLRAEEFWDQPQPCLHIVFGLALVYALCRTISTSYRRRPLIRCEEENFVMSVIVFTYLLRFHLKPGCST